jgi:hypothetical protein
MRRARAGRGPGRRGAAVVVVLAFLLLGGARGAGAQTESAGARAAQSLFDEGRSLMDAGRFAEACPKLAESQRLEPGGGTLLNLALCDEKLGLLATAWTRFNDALSLAIADHRSEREAFARAHIAALLPRLPRLRIQMDAQGPSGQPITVHLDGEAVPREALQTATPIDPGSHRLEASSAGCVTWTTTATAAEHDTVTVHVPVLEPLPVVGGAGPPGSPGDSPGSRSADAPSEPPPTELRRSQAFWIVGGVAVASGVASVLTGVAALSAHESADNKCVAARSFCSDPSGVNDAARARTYAWVSTATLGGAVLGGVVALLLPREARRPEVDLAPIAGGVVVGVRVALP